MTNVSSPGATMADLVDTIDPGPSAATMTAAAAPSAQVKGGRLLRRQHPIVSILVATMLPLAEVYDPSLARRWHSGETISRYVHVIGETFVDDVLNEFEIEEEILPSVISVRRRRAGLVFPQDWTFPLLGQRRPSRRMLSSIEEE